MYRIPPLQSMRGPGDLGRKVFNINTFLLVVERSYY